VSELINLIAAYLPSADIAAAYRRLRETRLFILDMDGTIYLGERALDGAAEFVRALRALPGRRVLFFTNNASRDIGYYEIKLQRLGFEPRDGELLSSAEVTARHIVARHPGAAVFVLGTDYLRGVFEQYGIRTVGADCAARPDIVVTSFDKSLNYPKLERACTFIRDGALWLSTHPDINCPTEYGFEPDCGAINACIAASVGGGAQPVYFGKPYRATIDAIQDLYGVPPEQMAVFGDRLYTDVALGKLHGPLACLVLTGETKIADLAGLTEEKLPDLIFEKIGDAGEIKNNI